MSEVALRPLTREEFYRAIDAGVYPDYERLELLDGQVYKRMTNKPPHSATIDVISGWLRTDLPTGSFVRVQLPIALGELSEPEPDISVLRGQPRDYLIEHPHTQDVLLVVEVSDCSRDQDLGVKLRLYATAGVAVYWVVDLRRRKVFVHRDPRSAAYGSVVTLGIDDSIQAPWGAVAQVRDLLP